MLQKALICISTALLMMGQSFATAFWAVVGPQDYVSESVSTYYPSYMRPSAESEYYRWVHRWDWAQN